MEHAIEVLEKAESVLSRRMRSMKDGKPRWAAQYKLNEIRSALSILKNHKS